MSENRSYCDWNASAPIYPAAQAAVVRALSLGNPSSVHAEGRAARAAVEVARRQVAGLLGVEPGQVTFTSGGTEGASTCLQPASSDDVLLVGAAEHACVLSGGQYAADRIEIVPVDETGRVTVEALQAAVDARGVTPGRVNLCLQIANNETGVVNPPEVFAAAANAGWHVTADAVQAAGRIHLAPYWPSLHGAFISAHKIGGPKGVGAVIARKGACGFTRPLLRGGGQESGQRGGTENVAGIVGFGAAAAEMNAAVQAWAGVGNLRDAFESRLLACAPDAVIFSRQAERLANTCLFAVRGLRAETALIAFDLDGVAVSSGSACSSGKVGKSHVLKAMGIADDVAACALRVSFGDRSTMADVDRLCASLQKQLARQCRSAA